MLYKENYKRYQSGKYHFVSSFMLFDEFGIDNCKVEWIEDYPCNSKKELEAREGKYQKENDCVNKRVAGRTIQEYNEDNRERLRNREREYRERKKEHIQQRKHNWYEKNKGCSYVCRCGSSILDRNKLIHEKSKKHQQYLQSQTNLQ